MSNPNSTDPIITSGLPARASLVCANGATLLAVCFFAHALRQRADAAHPVFAVIVQDLIALCAAQAAVHVSVLALTADYAFVVGFPLFIQLAAGQFHQISWLVFKYNTVYYFLSQIL